LDLNGKVARNVVVGKADTLKTKRALNELGFYRFTSVDPNPFPNSEMFSAIRAFQIKNDLAPDQVITPNGPTQRKLNQALARRQQLAVKTRETRDTRSGSMPWSDGTGFRRAERPGRARVGHGGKERTGNRATAFHAGPRTDGTASGVPVINMEEDRIPNILANEPARIEIVENPNADASDRWYQSDEAGKAAVAKHTALIELEATRQGVDPDLVRAIIFAENARGHYFGGSSILEAVGISETIFPMNINPSIWGGLGIDETTAHDPKTNIRAGVTLLSRIIARIDHPTPEKIASIWNHAGREKVNDFGAFVGRVYGEKLWQEK